MVGPKVYMAEPKVHGFDFSLAKVWIVMDEPNLSMAKHKIHMFDFSLDLV
jgi:hypothetical protein